MRCRKCNEKIYLSNKSQQWLAEQDGWPRCEIVEGLHIPVGETYDIDDDGDGDT